MGKSFCSLLTKTKQPQKPKKAPDSMPGGHSIKQLLKNKEFEQELSEISKMNQFAFKVPKIEELQYNDDEEKKIKVNEYEIEQKDIIHTFKGGESNAIKTMNK